MIKEEFAVPRIKCPSLESFRTNYLLPLKPVILEGIIDHWPALNEHPWRFVCITTQLKTAMTCYRRQINLILADFHTYVNLVTIFIIML